MRPYFQRWTCEAVTGSVPFGASYQFRVMPFGLKNAPVTFQMLLSQEALAVYLHRFAMVYLEDIIVYSADWEQHTRHL